jgi:metallo-beta-lactamase class B
MKLARARNATALLAGNQLVIYRKDKAPAALRVPVSEPDASVSLAIAADGWAVVGTTSRSASPPRKGWEEPHNLFVFDPDHKEPAWSLPINKDVEKAAPLEKGVYGMPTLPDGSKNKLPQLDEKVWAPLSVAIHSVGRTLMVAAADYQGWQRWVRSSATMKDDNQGVRFIPTKPTVTIYDDSGKILNRFAAEKFDEPSWCDLSFSDDGGHFHVTPHYWRSRGLGGQAQLRADETADKSYSVFLDNKKIESFKHTGLRMTRYHPSTEKLFMLEKASIIRCCDTREKLYWTIDLNSAVPKSLKPWVANARATPIVKGVWQLPGGRVESDLGGQRVIEAPDGLILIEGHAGLSFEREWQSMVAVGLDPKKVKYVLATHEHGDHAPGAYLWRVVTGAKFVCSEEMAYTLQHHIPLNTGYGLHPPVPTDIVVKKDETLDVAGLKVKAIRIPGHTAGSMAWYFEMASRERKRPEKFVAFGDLIMPNGVLGYSGSVNFSATDALASLRKLRDLDVDYVLPGHGAVEGPKNYFQAGIEVGTKVGWGFIKPERPDPRFRITQKNVVVVGFGHGATSAAFGDVNGDGKPDVVMVCPDGDGSVVKFFLNHGGKFNDEPDKEIKVPVSQPHKIRVVSRNGKAYVFVAGKSAAGLLPNGPFPSFQIVSFDLGDGNQLRFLEGARTLVSRRFGGFYEFEPSLDKKITLRKFTPEIDGPYVDFRLVGDDLLTAYGQLYRRVDGKFLKTPAVQLPREKDWQFLAVGDFNGDGKKDAAFLSYGMDKQTAARVFYGRDKNKLEFGEKADAVLPLSELLAETKKNQKHPLVRDTPVVADWNGDGIDDLIVAHGQSNEVLVFLGGKDGLSKDRVQHINLEYRVHYEHGVFVGDFNGDGKADLAVFGYTNTGVGAGGPPAVYIWLQ